MKSYHRTLYRYGLRPDVPTRHRVRDVLLRASSRLRHGHRGLRVGNRHLRAGAPHRVDGAGAGLAGGHASHRWPRSQLLRVRALLRPLENIRKRAVKAKRGSVASVVNHASHYHAERCNGNGYLRKGSLPNSEPALYFSFHTTFIK
ncbi:hypothetical protein JTE90_025018 [Oedothorax gibbosus]|uniref:Uncharacterized protein n=1 Tax=Oedothorax gibbosus TaxID=931172 RepID=A0AAV6TMJ9_9ARAC|nr:hypothetical protein JTE90_025018 [Oedothorax gibbosus]